MTKSNPTQDHSDFVQQRFEAPVSALRRHVSLNAHFGHSIANGKSLDNLNKTTSSTQSIRNNLFSTMNLQPANGLLDYKLGGVIGYGSSATVYSAFYLPENLRVAIKMIDLDMFERNQIDELRRETALMALSKHENVLPVYSSFVSGSKLCIVTPYLAGGSCLDIMKTAFSDGLDELSIATILKQTLDGLGYLHKNGHIHRDVKAGNLLIDDDGCVLVSDFGVSSSLSERGVRRTFVGTPCWMAPEVMEQAGYDCKADIWSFGITAIELASGKAPFAKYPPLKVLLMTLSNDPPTLVRETANHKYSKDFKDMVDLCLNKEPANRPTVEKLLSHPFFKQARKKEYLVKSILTGLPTLEGRPRKIIHRKQLSFTTVEEWDFNDDCDHQRKFSNDKDSSVIGKDGMVSNKSTSTGNTSLFNSSKTSTKFTGNSGVHDHFIDKEHLFTPKQEARISFDHSIRVDDNHGIKIFTEHSSDRSPSGMKHSDYDEDMEYQHAINNDSLKGTSQARSLLQTARSNDMYPTYLLTKSASSDCAGERKSRSKIQYRQDSMAVASHGSLLSSKTAPLSNDNLHSSYLATTSGGSTAKSITRNRSSSSSASSNQKYNTHEEKDIVDRNDSKKIGRFELFSAPPNDMMPLSDPPTLRRTSLDHQQLPAKSDHNAVTVSFSEPSSLRRQRAYSTDDHHRHYRLSDPPATMPSPRIQTTTVTGSTSPSNTFAHLQSHFEDLIRNNDAQQRVLYRILDSLQLPRPETSVHPHFQEGPTPPRDDSIIHVIGSLERQLRQIGNENDTLKSENEQLRKELDLLRLG